MILRFYKNILLFKLERNKSNKKDHQNKSIVKNEQHSHEITSSNYESANDVTPNELHQESQTLSKLNSSPKHESCAYSNDSLYTENENCTTESIAFNEAANIKGDSFVNEISQHTSSEDSKTKIKIESNELHELKKCDSKPNVQYTNKDSQHQFSKTFIETEQSPENINTTDQIKVCCTNLSLSQYENKNV